jgi:hypothetical protein
MCQDSATSIVQLRGIMWDDQGVIYPSQENMGCWQRVCLKNILVNPVESGLFFAISSDEILDASTTQNIVRENEQRGWDRARLVLSPKFMPPFKTRCQ